MSEGVEISKSIIQDDTIIIRKAKSDLKEGLLFAQLFDEASEGFFKSMLGPRTYEILAETFLKSNNEYSFENVSVIEFENKIVGMVSGYTFAEKKGFQKNCFYQFPKGAKGRIRMFSLVGRILSRFLGPREQDDYYLQSIAVNSNMRGKGLGQRLMEHSEEIAIKKGCRTLSLDVSSKNKMALKSYKKFGMETSSFWPNFLKLPPVFIRMEKEL